MKTIQFLLAFVFLFCLANMSTAQTNIHDADNDTRVETERTADQDIIWFQTGGIDRARFIDGRLEFLNTGNSVFIGDNAGLNDDLSNNQNFFLGEATGRDNVTGEQNVGLGRYALRDNETGSFNMAIGGSALLRNLASRNVGIGNLTLRNNTTGNDNVAIGFDALRFGDPSVNNTAVGSESMRNATTGANNLSMGYRAGYSLGSGTGNVLLGSEAGYNAGAGSGNIMIGYQAGYNETGSDKLYIENSSSADPLIGGDFSTRKVAIKGDFGIGVEPTRPFDIDGVATIGQMMTIDATAINPGNDLIQLTVPTGTAAGASFIEFQEASTIVANIGADGAADFHSLRVDRKASGSNNGNIIVQEASTGGFSRVTMRDQNGSDYWDIATLANGSATVPVAQMRFWYDDGAGNSRNILNVEGTEHKVGVNTTAPDAFLDVVGDAGSTDIIIDASTNYTGTTDVIAVNGTSVPSIGNGYGVYGSAVGGSDSWGGYFPTKTYATELRVGSTIGAVGYTLAVNGKAICEELKIQDSGSWPDYVFAPDYDLKPLEEVEAYINEHKHLPNIPSAAEITAAEGIHVGEMANKTIEKVEELTLYMIDANKRINELEKQNKELQEMVKALLDKK